MKPDPANLPDSSDSAPLSKGQERLLQAIPATSWPDRAQAARSPLFSELALNRSGSVRARTRTWVPAMVPWRATEEGFVTREVIAWYERFAQGKPGVLVVEATGIRDVASGPLLRIGHDRFLPGLTQLVEAVRVASEGQTRLLIQVIDFLSVRRRPEADKFFQRYLQLEERHQAVLVQLGHLDSEANLSEPELRDALAKLPVSEQQEVLNEREWEALAYGYRERVSDTHLEHIAQLPQQLPGLFANAAVRAQQAGFDGVELHYAHAYSMASFLSRTNDRSDGYGGDLAGRARLPLEVFAQTRKQVGADYPLGCRFLGDEVIDGGSRLQDALYFAEQFASAGMDFLSVSKGGKFDDAKQPKVGQAVYPYTGPSGHECMPTIKIDERGPFGRNLYLSRAIRERVRELGLTTPVVGAGGINSFEMAHEALTNGDCDAVGAARQTLADPDWFLKIERGQGQQIRRCVYTNYCEGLDQKHRQVTCQLWDRDLTTPDQTGSDEIARSHDGKRRLVAPPWAEAPEP